MATGMMMLFGGPEWEAGGFEMMVPTEVISVEARVPVRAGRFEEEVSVGVDVMLGERFVIKSGVLVVEAEPIDACE